MMMMLVLHFEAIGSSGFSELWKLQKSVSMWQFSSPFRRRLEHKFLVLGSLEVLRNALNCNSCTCLGIAGKLGSLIDDKNAQPWTHLTAALVLLT